MTILITPAEQKLARLDLELAARLGEQPDAATRVIAEASGLMARRSARDQAFAMQLELARRAGLMQDVAERSARGQSERAAVRQVLTQHPERVGAAVLNALALAKGALDALALRDAEKERVRKVYLGVIQAEQEVELLSEQEAEHAAESAALPKMQYGDSGFGPSM